MNNIPKCSNKKSKGCTGVACTICWGEKDDCKNHMREVDYHTHQEVIKLVEVKDGKNKLSV